MAKPSALGVSFYAEADAGSEGVRDSLELAQLLVREIGTGMGSGIGFA